MLDEAVSSLIADIYSGASNRETWNRTMEAIGDRLQAQFLMVATVDIRDRVPSGIDYHHVVHSRFADAASEYVEEIYKVDPTLHHAARHPDGGVFDSLGAIGAQDYLEHDYVKWNRSRCGSLFWRALHSGWGKNLNFGISLHRAEDAGPLADAELALLHMLFAHMKQAVQLAAEPPVLDGPEPTLLLSARGELLGASDSAIALMAARDGLMLWDSRPRAVAPAEAARLNAAIASALSARTSGGSGGALILRRPGGRTSWLVTVRPVVPRDIPFASLHPAVMIRLIDPAAAPVTRPDEWRAMFGFTQAESRLAEALLGGDGNLRRAAEALGIAYGTARAQLATLFAKANVVTQAQLVRLLTRVGSWLIGLVGGLVPFADLVA